MRWLCQPWGNPSTRSRPFGTEYVSKSNELKVPTDSEEDKSPTWFTSISGAYEAIQRLRIVHHEFAERRCPRIRQWLESRTISVSGMRAWKDCTSQNYRTLLNFRLCDEESPRNNKGRDLHSWSQLWNFFSTRLRNWKIKAWNDLKGKKPMLRRKWENVQWKTLEQCSR